MKQVLLTKAVGIKNQRVKPFDGGKEYLATGGLTGSKIRTEAVTYKTKPSRADLLVTENQLIVARMKETNKVLLIDENTSDLIVSTGFLVLDVQEGWDSGFLFHYFVSGFFQKQKDKFSIGATQKTINNEKFKEILIPEISLDDQKHIVKILDEADALCQKRKQAIELLDDYLKSVFLEMFGDPVRNQKNWKLMKLGDISESRLGKMRDKQYITGKYLNPYLGNSNVKWFHFDLLDLLEMDFNDQEKIKYSLNEGDLLICEGGEIGRCAIWKNQQPNCYFQKAIHRVRTNKQIILPEYLQWILWFYSKGNAFKESRTQATIAHLTGIKLKRLPIPVADIDLQNKFATTMKIVESIKYKMLAQSNDLDIQFQALIQKAFKGES